MTRTVKKPDIRRQELLDIGVKLFFEAGEKEISIQEVVKQANVATGLFYYYFKSKNDFIDEALNNYVNNELSSLERILEDKTLTAEKKLEAVLEAYFLYVKKMAPFRSSAPFQTKRHYALTERLITRLKSKVNKLVLQGVSENVFEVDDVYTTVGFLLYGLTTVFDASTNINEDSFMVIKEIVYKILKGDQNENNH